MTSYVTREEYERLSERLAKLEAGELKVTVNVDGSSEYASRLVRECVREAIAEYGRHFDRSLARRA